ncbi:MAG: hypothetical protein ACKO37_06470 [Vampirovibrionales bacterium]
MMMSSISQSVTINGASGPVSVVNAANTPSVNASANGGGATMSTSPPPITLPNTPPPPPPSTTVNVPPPPASLPSPLALPTAPLSLSTNIILGQQPTPLPPTPTPSLSNTINIYQNPQSTNPQVQVLNQPPVAPSIPPVPPSINQSLQGMGTNININGGPNAITISQNGSPIGMANNGTFMPLSPQMMPQRPGFPPMPPNGMPNGMPMNGMPNGMPMNGMPNGMPMSGMPNGMPMNGFNPLAQAQAQAAALGQNPYAGMPPQGGLPESMPPWLPQLLQQLGVGQQPMTPPPNQAMNQMMPFMLMMMQAMKAKQDPGDDKKDDMAVRNRMALINALSAGNHRPARAEIRRELPPEPRRMPRERDIEDEPPMARSSARAASGTTFASLFDGPSGSAKTSSKASASAKVKSK